MSWPRHRCGTRKECTCEERTPEAVPPWRTRVTTKKGEREQQQGKQPRANANAARAVEIATAEALDKETFDKESRVWKPAELQFRIERAGERVG